MADEDGDPHAQVWAASHYYWGNEGFPQDRALAHEYYGRAAEQGLPEAQYNLGVVESEGFEGHPPDQAAAEKHFEAAHEAGYVLINVSVRHTCPRARVGY